MKSIIETLLDESIAVKSAGVRENLERLIRSADLMAECLTAGHKLMIFGNGGSAADAQHIAAEFVNRFQIERPPLAALALTTDTSILTSIGNDYAYSDIFSKQIRALGRKGDVALGISTSGNSPNVVQGIEAAAQMQIHTLGLSGPGGKLADLADIALTVNSTVTARIQETHIFMGHVLCDLVDRILFPTHYTS